MPSWTRLVVAVSTSIFLPWPHSPPPRGHLFSLFRSSTCAQTKKCTPPDSSSRAHYPLGHFQLQLISPPPCCCGGRERCIMNSIILYLIKCPDYRNLNIITITPLNECPKFFLKNLCHTRHVCVINFCSLFHAPFQESEDRSLFFII